MVLIPQFVGLHFLPRSHISPLTHVGPCDPLNASEFPLVPLNCLTTTLLSNPPPLSVQFNPCFLILPLCQFNSTLAFQSSPFGPFMLIQGILTLDHYIPTNGPNTSICGPLFSPSFSHISPNPCWSL